MFKSLIICIIYICRKKDFYMVNYLHYLYLCTVRSTVIFIVI